MGRTWSNWKGFHAFKDKILSEIYSKNKTIKFDSFEETELAWKIKIKDKVYIFPKSKTILFHADNTIQVPDWLYLKNFKDSLKKDL